MSFAEEQTACVVIAIVIANGETANVNEKTDRTTDGQTGLKVKVVDLFSASTQRRSGIARIVKG